ncbi:hypothetical protein Q7A53_05220 [Halobacillus rhizosphaerae]|uniref:hypothetical protein n=1 Tax=Halobacillus rhizosphaerae TaxID=3064889 RepID=UPI00398AFAD5
MIEVRILKAKKNIVLNKNATFLEGEFYFSRVSKKGIKIVVRSEEGYWIPIDSYKIYSGYKLMQSYGFSIEKTIYMKNRQRLYEFSNADEYLNGDNFKRTFIGYGYIDRNFYE